MDFWTMQEAQIDIKDFDKNGVVEEPAGEKQRIPFFGSMSKNKETTWVISLFVFVHLVAFFCTMIVNNCWSKSHGDCTLMFFQPLSENPLLGPSSSALVSFLSLNFSVFLGFFLRFLELLWFLWTCDSGFICFFPVKFLECVCFLFSNSYKDVLSC